MERHAMKHANGSPSGGSSTPPSTSGNDTCGKSKKFFQKKREGDVVSKQSKPEVIQAEHEAFLQAFEKPSQIYRYMGSRNKLQPVFLHRNLTYMRNRMSRSHKSRQSFKINGMLVQKLSKLRSEKANALSASGEYLSLFFLGFFDKKNPTNRTLSRVDDIAMKDSFDDEDEQKFSKKRTVFVETFLLKISHNKRKDISSTLKQIAVGKSEVVINPTEDPVTFVSTYDAKPPVVSIPTESFRTLCSANHVTGAQVSFMLLFRVHYATPPSAGNGNGCFDSVSNGHANGDAGSDVEAPSAKRQKLISYSKLFVGELAIYDKQGRFLLKEADYELTVQEVQPQQKSFVTKYSSPTKNWGPEGYDTMDYSPSDDCSDVIKTEHDPSGGPKEGYDGFMKEPSLKVKIQWTKEPPLGVENGSTARNGCSDKENYKPPSSLSESFKKGLNININNNSILTHGAATGRLHEADVDQSSSDGSITPPEVKPTIFLPDSNALVPSSSSSSSCGGGRTSDVGGLENGHDVKRVMYQLIHNNTSRQQTETTEFICPWCGLNCCILYSLLKHLKLCHARFVFNFVPIPNGARIDVSINELYDGSYNGSPHDLLSPTIGFTRRGPVRRTVVTNLLVCRPRRQKPSLSEFIDTDENEFDSQRPYITGHSRMYHHTMTCLPVYPRELDVDSEGESDPLWLQHKTMQMIDEFTDVNEGEKELMKMWNLHVMKYGYVGDCQIPIALEMFIERRGRELWERNLYRNFVLHMSSMFDFGLVSAEVMQRIVRKLRKIPINDEELQQKMLAAREEQMKYWNTVTVHKKVHKPDTRNGAGERSSGAGASSSSGGHAPYHLHKTVHVGSGNGPTGTGDGMQRKVKPTITPAKNTDPAAISPPRRRSAAAAAVTAVAKGVPSSSTTATLSASQSSTNANKGTHSSGTSSKNGTVKALLKAPSASTSYAPTAGPSKKSSAASSTMASHHSPSSSISTSNYNKLQHSHSKVTFSPIMTRRKSLSVGTHLTQSQRKRSLN